MKNLILIFVAIVFSISCQSEKAKPLTKYEQIAKMELRYISNMSSEDAKNKLILEIGQTDYDWYIKTGEKIHNDLQKSDSIERHKLDSMKQNNRQ